MARIPLPRICGGNVGNEGGLSRLSPHGQAVCSFPKTEIAPRCVN